MVLLWSSRLVNAIIRSYFFQLPKYCKLQQSKNIIMGLLSILFLGFISLIFSLILYLIYNQRRHANHFKKFGVPYMGAGVGRFFKMFTQKSQPDEMEKEIYREAKQSNNSPIVGFTDMLFGPYAIYVTDMELIKHIYIKDFDHFINRRPIGSKNSGDLFSRMLFSMEGEQWKGIRSKLSTSFTSSKIRNMFQIFNKSSLNMVRYIKNHNGPEADVDLFKICSKYFMDVIASCAFAIDSKAWEVPFGQTSKFEDMGREFQFSFKPSKLLKFIVMASAPKLADLFGFQVFDAEAQNYFSTIIKDMIKQRRQSGERSEDFLQLMLDAQKGILKADEETNLVMNGTLENDKVHEGSLKTPSKVTFDDDDILANCLLFLLAGFDNTHAVLMFVLYALALNPEAQEKLFQEVTSKMNESGGKLTYDNVLDMTYLDMVLNETLRIYSPATRTERMCTKDYPVPGINFTIKKGTIAIIPVYAIQNDHVYFPDPEKFIPERFTPENKKNRNAYVYMPFGHGPRNCIGMRFVLMEVKAVVAQLVYNFRFSPCAKTKIPMEYTQAAVLKPKDELWLKISSR